MDEETKKERNVVMGVLSYLGPLVIVSYIVAQGDEFVKFHVKQGLVLLIIEVVVWLIEPFMWQFWPIFQIINLCVFVLAILGIINVLQHKEKVLPVVGDFAKSFKI